MFDLVRKSQLLFSVGQFDHASGRVVSLEMVVSVAFGSRCLKSRSPHPVLFSENCHEQDPYSSSNEGGWGMTPFNGEVF
jgi:hypothetical protein